MSCVAGAHAQSRPLVIEHVAVLTMTTPRPLTDQTVIIRDGRIVAVTASARAAIPRDAQRIDGTGRYLMPGLAEMHAHVPPGNPPTQYVDRVLSLYLLNGVTTARGMLGDPKHLALRAQLERAERFGPRLVTSGPSLNGTSAPTVEIGMRLVREQKAAGYDFMKIHPGITREVFDSIAATAAREGIGFAGHVPIDVGLGRALDARYLSVDHVDGVVEALLRPAARGKAASSQFFGLNLIDDIDPRGLDSVVRAIKTSGVHVVTTQTIFDHIVGLDPPEVIAARPEMRYWPTQEVQAWIRQKGAFLAGAAASPEQRTRYLAFRQTLLRALRAADVPIVLGSDGPQVWNVPGFSVHREMRALVAAGWSPFEVLRMGTVNVARFFNWNDAGGVAPGMRADLLLLDANPLEDIVNASRIRSVIRAGRLYDRGELDARLAALAVPPT